ncbi:MAG: alpha/beta fold hydrolase [Elusimicrobia bacterium]|nr:alpha/beta fold hydrolase [Elusimicrobiota bacterium]
MNFKTADGWILAAEFHPPRKGRETLILLHGLGAGRGEWDFFRAQTHKRGYGTLALDFRGHGESTSGPRVRQDYTALVQDVYAALQFLRKKSILEQKVVLVGASIGANIALRAAVQRPRLKKCILLSPGIDYHGVKAETEMEHYGSRPLLLVASVPDAYAFASSHRLLDIGKRHSVPVLFIEAEEGHGVTMLQSQRGKKILKQILDWI